jgi:GNAT superfamily N-acetyltransferase
MVIDASVSIEDQPKPADLEFLENQINTYNMVEVGAYDGRALAIFVRDATGAIIAGLSGFTWARMCEINFLWVHPELQGQGYGSQLLRMAEAEARARGCLITILGTYSFQAPAFYQRLGYELAGQLTDCPPGHTNYYLYKRLSQ